MSLLMKCTACSKSSENQVYSLLCLHFLCKDCFKCSINIRTEDSKEENGHTYIPCPTCAYHTTLGCLKFSQSENLCKMPHVLKTLIDLQYGVLYAKLGEVQQNQSFGALNARSIFVQNVSVFILLCQILINIKPTAQKIYKMTRAFSLEQESSVTNMTCVGRKYATIRVFLVATVVFLLIM